MNTSLKNYIAYTSISIASVLFLSGCCTNNKVLDDETHITPSAQQNEVSYKAQGSEPDWIVTVHKDNNLLFSTPAVPDGIELTANRLAFAKGVEYTGMYQNKPFALVLKGDKCTDTMADITYAMTAVFEFNDQLFKGCATAN